MEKIAFVDIIVVFVRLINASVAEAITPLFVCHTIRRQEMSKCKMLHRKRLGWML